MSEVIEIKDFLDNIEIPKCPDDFDKKTIEVALDNYKDFIDTERKRLGLSE